MWRIALAVVLTLILVLFGAAAQQAGEIPQPLLLRADQVIE